MISSWPWTTRLSAMTGRCRARSPRWSAGSAAMARLSALVRVRAGRAAVVAEHPHDLLASRVPAPASVERGDELVGLVLGLLGRRLRR